MTSKNSAKPFSDAQLDKILEFFESSLPGEMPNALMSELTKYLQTNHLLKSDVDTDPETSDFIHSYESDSDTESECESDCSGSTCSASTCPVPTKRSPTPHRPSKPPPQKKPPTKSIKAQKYVAVKRRMAQTVHSKPLLENIVDFTTNNS